MRALACAHLSIHIYICCSYVEFISWSKIQEVLHSRLTTSFAWRTYRSLMMFVWCLLRVALRLHAKLQLCISEFLHKHVCECVCWQLPPRKSYNHPPAHKWWLYSCVSSRQPPALHPLPLISTPPSAVHRSNLRIKDVYN